MWTGGGEEGDGAGGAGLRVGQGLQPEVVWQKGAEPRPLSPES